MSLSLKQLSCFPLLNGINNIANPFTPNKCVLHHYAFEVEEFSFPLYGGKNLDSNGKSDHPNLR